MQFLKIFELVALFFCRRLREGAALSCPHGALPAPWTSKAATCKKKDVLKSKQNLKKQEALRRAGRPLRCRGLRRTFVVLRHCNPHTASLKRAASFLMLLMSCRENLHGSACKCWACTASSPVRTSSTFPRQLWGMALCRRGLRLKSSRRGRPHAYRAERLNMPWRLGRLHHKNSSSGSIA